MKTNHFNCIYMYVNKINEKKYIGQTNNFNRRKKEHYHYAYNNTKNDYNFPLHKAIRKYGIENFDLIILKENLNSKCLLNIWESYYINKFDTLCKNNNGYNITDGGLQGNPFAGKTDEEMFEIKKKMSKNKKKMSKKSNNNISEINKKRTGTNNPRHKSVLQFSKDGNFIKKWDFIKQASDELKIDRSDITKCCKGKKKSAGGFMWSYESE